MNAAEEILGPPLAAGLADQPALILGQTQLSYAGLEALVNRCGHALLAAGVGREQRVLLFMDDSPEFVALYLAAMKIGAVVVAFNIRATAADLRFVVEDSDCRALFIDAAFVDRWQEAGTGIADGPRVIVRGGTGRDSLERFLPGHAEALEYAAMAPDDMAFWLYSSGTTGQPKGVVHCHHDVCIADRHLRENLGLRAGERLFTTSKLFFAFALGHSLFGGLRCGATVILYEGWPDGRAIIAEVERTRPQLLFTVPAFYRNLLAEGVAASEAFRQVRHFVSAGEKLPLPLFEQWQAATGRPILEGIGTSETVFLFLANTPDAVRPGSAGRRLPWADVRLWTGSGEEITAPDTPGTLWVRMDSVFDRYWRLQARTHATFRDGYYCTGDVFSFDADGYWHHHGRDDDMLKISGQWVSPAEIEDCVLRIDAIREAAVVGAPNADGLVRAALFVVAEGDGARDALEERIRATLTGSLSIYKCPRTICFVDEIPRTATGKVQRFKLRDML
ncbi:MAG: benzoate-CoA ligase family protein [Gammaproteobacteria bacterium]|nr:benzoate-CoA ligase family protein [Gammaproteobacteria bacterium]